MVEPLTKEKTNTQKLPTIKVTRKNKNLKQQQK